MLLVSSGLLVFGVLERDGVEGVGKGGVCVCVLRHWKKLRLCHVFIKKPRSTV